MLPDDVARCAAASLEGEGAAVGPAVAVGARGLGLDGRAVAGDDVALARVVAGGRRPARAGGARAPRAGRLEGVDATVAEREDGDQPGAGQRLEVLGGLRLPQTRSARRARRPTAAARPAARPCATGRVPERCCDLVHGHKYSPTRIFLSRNILACREWESGSNVASQGAGVAPNQEELGMKYTPLIQANKQGWDEMPGQWTEDDVKAMVGDMDDLNRDLQAAGEMVEGRGLAGPDRMKNVRAGDDGEPIVTDGPFTETKEGAGRRLGRRRRQRGARPGDRSPGLPGAWRGWRPPDQPERRGPPGGRSSRLINRSPYVGCGSWSSARSGARGGWARGHRGRHQ